MRFTPADELSSELPGSDGGYPSSTGGLSMDEQGLAVPPLGPPTFLGGPPLAGLYPFSDVGIPNPIGKCIDLTFHPKPNSA